MVRTETRQRFGCKFHNDCESCPFVDCLAAATMKGRVLLLYKSGWSNERIAKYLHMKLEKIAKWTQSLNEQTAGRLGS